MVPAPSNAPVQEDLFTETKDTFAVDLDVFQGPFDVLLSLIARHRLDITDVALAQVTDEFLAFVAKQEELDLSGASEFLVVAATLLDLKAARLLPHEEDDAETIELLEARDLLFAKLLQYRAFKEVAVDIAVRFQQQSLSFPRIVDLEPHFRSMLPELEFNVDATDLAIYAAQALTRKSAGVTLDHLHDPLVPVDSQVILLRERLLIGDRISFTQVCADARNIPTVVSRFLAVLELIRAGELAIEQDSPLGTLVLTRIEPAMSGTQISPDGADTPISQASRSASYPADSYPADAVDSHDIAEVP
ncbi:segregation and condensation protein A [Arcanobacterium bovis]|uniref:Segregation and condensation protein A n=1 Tax=Arcanobacterium bovis TaxID=2529275 RepID=A0A4Q9V1F3_9ACTO|nr:ScpA family protein [Arcanobacterium bovis]TBW22940.1 segregation/condensation protein A [Arcanobacterium bovis]